MLSLYERLEAAHRQRLAGGRGAHIGFQLSESEINDYLRYSLKQQPRPGVETVSLKFFPSDYLSSFTVIDFDAVERWKPGTVPVLLRPILRGKKGLWIDLRFRASGGQTTFQVEKAYFENIRVPVIVVEKLIAIVAARQPEKYDTTRPLPLPFGLRRVWTENQRLAGEN